MLVALAFMGWPLALALLPFLIAVGLSQVAGQRALDWGCHRGAGPARDGPRPHRRQCPGTADHRAYTYGLGRLAEIAENGRTLSVAQLRFLHHQAIQSGVIEVLTALGGLAVLVVGGLCWRTRAGWSRRYVPLATLLSLPGFGPVTDIAKVAKQLAETLAASRRSSPSTTSR